MMLQQLLRKVRVALTPRSRLLRTRLPDGTLILGRNRAGFGGRGVYIERDTLEPELRLLPLLLPPGGVLIDVGANTGVYSLVGARLTGSDGIVVSLEPFVDVLATLRLSVEANGFHNMRLRNVCAGRETGVAEFWMNHDKPTHSVSCGTTPGRKSSPYRSSASTSSSFGNGCRASTSSRSTRRAPKPKSSPAPGDWSSASGRSCRLRLPSRSRCSSHGLRRAAP